MLLYFKTGPRATNVVLAGTMFVTPGLHAPFVYELTEAAWYGTVS